MIDYETYKRKFGIKDKRSNEYRAGLPKDMYDLLSREDKFGVGFEGETQLALIEDILIKISGCIMNEDKDKTLKSYKKLGGVIKNVLIKHRKDENVLSDRYYDISPSPEEKEMFVRVPRVNEKGDITSTISAVLFGLSKFYRAMNTNTGVAVYQAIINEKKKALESLYDDKHKNGTCSYYNAINWILATWIRRIALYESTSRNLKWFNGGVKNAGTGK